MAGEALKLLMVAPTNLEISSNMHLVRVVISSNTNQLKINLISNNMVKSTMHMERSNITSSSRNPAIKTNNLTTRSSINSHSSHTISQRTKAISRRDIKSSQSSTRITISSRRNKLISNLPKVTKININPNINLRLNNKCISRKLSLSSHIGRLSSITLPLLIKLIMKKRNSSLSTNRKLKITTIKRRVSMSQRQSNISR